MRYVNLHNHSIFSDGRHNPEEIVLEAIEKNMLGIGFSDHSYTDFDPSYCMLPERFEAYHSTLDGLKAKYADRIRVFKGIELDYYSEADPADFDYRIASVHYVTDAKNYVSSGQLHCYSRDGKRKWSMRTGDIPAHMCFVYR